MALRDKPQKTVVDDKRIDQLIGKGGSTAAAVADEDTMRNLQIRPLASVVDRIDRILERRPKGARLSRHAWIMNAVLRQLEQEET